MDHVKSFCAVFAFIACAFAFSWWTYSTPAQRGVASVEAHHQPHVHYDPSYKL